MLVTNILNGTHEDNVTCLVIRSMEYTIYQVSEEYYTIDFLCGIIAILQVYFGISCVRFRQPFNQSCETVTRSSCSAGQSCANVLQWTRLPYLILPPYTSTSHNLTARFVRAVNWILTMLPIVPERQVNDVLQFVFRTDSTSVHCKPGRRFAGSSAVILILFIFSPTTCGIRFVGGMTQ